MHTRINILSVTRACTYTYVSMYVRAYVRIRRYVCTYVRVCKHVCMHACMHACMYVCMYVRLSVCIYVCIYTHVCLYRYTQGQRVWDGHRGLLWGVMVHIIRQVLNMLDGVQQ